MARSLNEVNLIGRLGRDPEMRYTAAGTAVCSFTLATNRFRQGADGTPQEETDWHNIVTWDKLAETCNQYLTKGRLVYIKGSLQTRSWEQDGQKRYKTEVVAREMIILDSARDRADGAPTGAGNGAHREPVGVGAGDQDLDELPF